MGQGKLRKELEPKPDVELSPDQQSVMASLANSVNAEQARVSEALRAMELFAAKCRTELQLTDVYIFHPQKNCFVDRRTLKNAQ